MNLEKLKQYFKQAKLPKQIRLNSCTNILDVEFFVDRNISVLEANTGNRTYLPYYLRLLELYNLLNK